jgi:hypothetical protein
MEEVCAVQASRMQFKQDEEKCGTTYFPVAVTTPLCDNANFSLTECPSMDFYGIVACRPAARQRPRNKQIYNSRC